MRVLMLGAGKTGSLVAEVARERGHQIDVLRSADNANASGVNKERLANVDVAIDFTTPDCALENMRACIASRINMVVGTTGWYSHAESIRSEVEQHQVGCVFGSNFSIGVNQFFELVQAAAPALQHHYSAQIYERHHAQKKDAPSGTAATMQRLLKEATGSEVEITSFREGDVVGMHELVLNSAFDSIYLCHDAKSRRGFAEGAVKAAEWIRDKNGFFDFKDIWREV